MPVDFQNEPLKSPIKLVKSKHSIGPFRRRMAKSKSAKLFNDFRAHLEKSQKNAGAYRKSNASILVM
jgi:hypothetical protein